ncbi:hypothetical protein KM043_005236 [Ampulex compressa]|nr:hypothetical protein KM043_005236 [Ampulex compressa]
MSSIQPLLGHSQPPFVFVYCSSLPVSTLFRSLSSGTAVRGGERAFDRQGVRIVFDIFALHLDGLKNESTEGHGRIHVGFKPYFISRKDEAHRATEDT